MAVVLFSSSFLNRLEGNALSRVMRFGDGGATAAYSSSGLLPAYVTGGTASGRILLLKGTMPSLPYNQLPSWTTDISPNILVEWRVGTHIVYTQGANDDSFSVGTYYNQATASGTATWVAILVQQGNSLSNIHQIIYGSVGVIGSGADLVIGNTTITSGNYYMIHQIPFSIPFTWTY